MILGSHKKNFANLRCKYLWKFVEILNEAYDDSVTIENKALRSEVLTTRFDNESLSQILSIISETFDITVEKQGHHYILK